MAKRARRLPAPAHCAVEGRSHLRAGSGLSWLAISLPLCLVVGISLLFALGGAQPLNAGAETIDEAEIGVVEPAAGHPAETSTPVPPAPVVDTDTLPVTPPPADELPPPEEIPAPDAVTPAEPVPEAAPATIAPPEAPVTPQIPDEPTPAADSPSEAGAEARAGFVPADHSGLHNTRESSFAAAATAAARGSQEVNQCNGIFNVGGQTVTCNVTVTNEIRRNRTTQVICTDTGAAQTCTTTSGPPITTITQCNGSGNGGGGTVICRVTVINNVHAGAVDSLVKTTVVQCVGSGRGGGSQPTIDCSPANTPGAPTPPTVSQCNGSGNGGGGQRRVICTVTGDDETFPITVDQCNGSGNGGGAIVICTTDITTNILRRGDGGNGNPPGGGGGNPPGGGGGNPPGGNPPGGDVPPGGPPPPGTDIPPSGGPPTDGSTPPGRHGPPSRPGGQLPFTGFDPGITAVFGAFLLLTGMSLNRILTRRHGPTVG